MNVVVSTERGAAIDTDALIVSLFEDERPDSGELAELDKALNGALTRLVDLGDARGKLHETALVYTAAAIRAPRVIVVGAGPRPDFTPDRMRTVAGTALRFATRHKVKRPALMLRGDLDPLARAAAAAEGAIMAIFDTGTYRTSGERPEPPETLTLVEPDPGNDERTRQGTRRGVVLGEATNFARQLINEPANCLGPVELAEAARKMAEDVGLECDILDEQRMRELGMNAILAVSQGSARPPRLIVLRYRAQSSVAPLGLVGKAVTFDSGGISIKPAERMHEMKMDMSGGAAVIAAMKAIAQLKPPIEVIGVVGATENMPSGTAMRPSDVIKAMNGKTIEVLNTDAEGRIVLADAVAYACRLGAARVVDAATLTGAVVVALGHVCAGLLGRPQDWVDAVARAAQVAGEKTWQLPLFDEYKEQLRSSIADISNTGGRPAGTITGAMFIGEFAEPGTPWAHLDIAGTAWTDRDLPYLAKGPTGIGVRTFTHLAFQLATQHA